MGVHCDNCYAHNEGFPCIKCGWQPGNAVGPSPFDTTPTAPVQDDDAELLKRLRNAERMIEDWAEQDERPTLTGFGINLLHGAITKAIERLSRLSPTPETGLVEALKEWAFEKAATFHRLAVEDRHLRTEYIASSSAYRELALEIERRESLSNVSRLED